MESDELALRRLLRKYAVAWHLVRHAGLYGECFDNCRRGFCRDWHELMSQTISTPRRSIPSKCCGTASATDRQ